MIKYTSVAHVELLRAHWEPVRLLQLYQLSDLIVLQVRGCRDALVVLSIERGRCRGGNHIQWDLTFIILLFRIDVLLQL